MKCLAYSNRYYNKELSEEVAKYNPMLHTAYKQLYLTCFYGVKETVSLQKQLKTRYGMNDDDMISRID
ncbi:hypothetical protein DES51_11059 [Dielma fastidiosa]|uniref:Uncharacterized protein n=2 Tax=Dielma fastidiosa TaxID=1034346 RepID=A0A318KJ93_9FIRM|nr:hypothetical protein DES51_11059 [Dielma fastidiosa]